MSRHSQRWQLLPMALAVVVFAALSGWTIAAGILAAVLVLALIGGPRVDADRLAQLALILTSLVGAVLLGPDAEELPRGKLESIWALFSCACLFTAAHRHVLTAPMGGLRATAAVAACGVMALGGYQADWVWRDGEAMAFIVGAGLWGLLQLDLLARQDPTWAPDQKTSLGFGVIVLAVLLSAPMMWAIPTARDAIRNSIWNVGKNEVGFGPDLELGSLSGMLVNEEPVLRVTGAPVDHLRGAVYTYYARGRWVRGPAGVRLEAAAAGGDATSIQSIGNVNDTYFAPLGARRFQVDRGSVDTDDLGLIGPNRGRAEWISFDLGERDVFHPAPPTDQDRQIPEELLAPLEAIAREWASDGSAAARVQAIAQRLRSTFTYSLDFERAGERDPVLEFLADKTGHCEYFASAMALLSRSVGVPARVVGGFTVTEQNPLTGSWIVRQKNAHAWTEVWLDGKWITLDATAPTSLLTHKKAGWMTAFGDALGYWRARIWRWVKARSATELAGVAAVLLALWALIRLIRRRRHSEKRVLIGGFEAPSPALTELLTALIKRGEQWESTESLESLARRVRTSEKIGDSGAAVSEAIMGYAALRYGGIGSAGAVDAQLQSAAARL